MPTSSSTNPRPIYLHLFKIRLPIPGVVSILHRISGALLFLFGIPLLLYAVQSSLVPHHFASAKVLFSQAWVKLIVIGLIWAYLYHLAAGIRYLLLDIHYGTDLVAARRSSWIVLVVSLSLTLILAIRLW